MRILKIILFATVLLLGISSCFAQEISFRGGLNLSQYRIKYENLNGPAEGTQLKPGLNIGPILELPVTNIFSLETGILFTSKGFKSSMPFNGAHFDGHENLFYLDFPILLKITVPINKVGVFAMAGPYVGEALYGKEKEEFTFNSTTDKFENTIMWGDKPYEYDRLDYGLKFGVGLRYGKGQIGVSYQLGIKDFSNHKLPPSPVLRNHRVIELYISYALINLKSNKK